MLRRKNKNEVEVSIKKTYELIKEYVPHSNSIDSMEVVKQVEEYRQYWKPEETNVVLLAESHVYTDEQDYEIECDGFILNKFIPNYPLRFVRFVYCLGYGESKLLTRVRTDRKNMGTPQFWKIFSSCVAVNENDLGFHRVLKTGTPSLLLRLRNKVDVLRKLKEKGIWLLDASIVGIYRSGIMNKMIRKKIIKICWQRYVSNVILESSPKHVVVIGKGVSSILGRELRKLDIAFTTIPQPQARGTSQWQLENYKKYQRICATYC